MSDNKTLRAVADAAQNIMMGETLKGDQHKIDKNKNNKIDAQDFELLQKEKNVKQEASCNKMRKEEDGNVDEAVVKKVNPKTGATEITYTGEDAKKKRATPGKYGYGPSRAKSLAKIGLKQAIKKEDIDEETEQLDEYKPHESGVTRIQGRAYGASKPEKHAVDTMKGPTRKELEKMDKKKPFKEMLELYAEKGLEALSEMTMTEEPDQEQFEKELAVAKKKATEKKSPEDEAKVAKSLVQSVKIEEEEVEQLDELSPKTLGSYAKKAAQSLSWNAQGYAQTKEKRYGDKMSSRTRGISKSANKLVKKATNEEVEQINERPMTDTEMKKREDVVMGMKKNLKGFKDRYGARAKDVMYATATKQAMKEDEE